MSKWFVMVMCASAVAHAGELDDIKKVPMKAVDSVVVIDSGQQPQKKISYHFMAGAKRTFTTTMRKTVRALVQGQTTEAPQEETSQETTYEAKSVARDGTMTIELSDKTGAVSFEITAQGKARVKVNPDKIDDEGAKAMVAVINSSPTLLPAEAVGIGAKWQMFTRNDALGAPSDVVTQVTLTKIEGDKISLHLVQDIRMDAAALFAKMGMPGLKAERSNSQNVADIVLDLASPSLMAQSQMVTLMEIKGKLDGNQPVEMELVRRATIVERNKTAIAVDAKQLAGTWTWAWSAVSDSMVLRADGSGEDGGKAKHKWRLEGDTLIISKDGRPDRTAEVLVIGDIMVLHKPGLRHMMWKRK